MTWILQALLSLLCGVLTMGSLPLTAVTNENKVEVQLSLPSAFCCETWDEWEQEWMPAYGTIVDTLRQIYPNMQLGGNLGSCESFPLGTTILTTLDFLLPASCPADAKEDVLSQLERSIDIAGFNEGEDLTRILIFRVGQQWQSNDTDTDPIKEKLRTKDINLIILTDAEDNGDFWHSLKMDLGVTDKNSVESPIDEIKNKDHFVQQVLDDVALFVPEMTTTTPAPPATDALTDPAAPSLTAVTNENKVEVHLSLPSAFCCETWDEWEQEWMQAYGTIVHTLHKIYPNLQLGANVGSCDAFPLGTQIATTTRFDFILPPYCSADEKEDVLSQLERSIDIAGFSEGEDVTRIIIFRVGLQWQNDFTDTDPIKEKLRTKDINLIILTDAEDNGVFWFWTKRDLGVTDENSVESPIDEIKNKDHFVQQVLDDVALFVPEMTTTTPAPPATDALTDPAAPSPPKGSGITTTGTKEQTVTITKTQVPLETNALLSPATTKPLHSAKPGVDKPVDIFFVMPGSNDSTLEDRDGAYSDTVTSLENTYGNLSVGKGIAACSTTPLTSDVNSTKTSAVGKACADSTLVESLENALTNASFDSDSDSVKVVVIPVTGHLDASLTDTNEGRSVLADLGQKLKDKGVHPIIYYPDPNTNEEQNYWDMVLEEMGFGKDEASATHITGDSQDFVTKIEDDIKRLVEGFQQGDGNSAATEGGSQNATATNVGIVAGAAAGLATIGGAAGWAIYKRAGVNCI